jgi:hypothetical protein
MVITIIMLFILLILVILVMCTLFSTKKDHYAKGLKIQFRLSGNKIIFQSTHFVGVYELTLPNNIVIKPNDEVYIAYNHHLGRLTGLHELYIVDKFKLEVAELRLLELKMILN